MSAFDLGDGLTMDDLDARVRERLKDGSTAASAEVSYEVRDDKLVDIHDHPVDLTTYDDTPEGKRNPTPATGLRWLVNRVLYCWYKNEHRYSIHHFGTGGHYPGPFVDYCCVDCGVHTQIYD